MSLIEEFNNYRSRMNDVILAKDNLVIKISTINLGKYIQIRIEDNGIGMNKETQKRIFEKFYRVGDEATRTTKGTGLGLYLCKMIARDHNADISVRSVVGEGAVFTVSFKQ